MTLVFPNIMIGVAVGIVIAAATLAVFRTFQNFRNPSPCPVSAAIHKAIKAIPKHLDLADPREFTNLPFPSLAPIPSQRFNAEQINGISRFEYMGRSKFRELQKRTEGRNFLKGNESLYVYGTSGSGKSHLLAALACHLIREERRVFYIPDCSALLMEPAITIWRALHFAFYDLPALKLVDPCNIDAMIHFMSKNRDVYIMVDQVNALETSENDSSHTEKGLALKWLRAMRFEHRYIFSASANENSNREADRKQSGIIIFPMFGGMNVVCQYLQLFHIILMACRSKRTNGLSTMPIGFQNCCPISANTSNISLAAFRFYFAAFSTSMPSLSLSSRPSLN